MTSFRPARDEFHLARDELRPARAFDFFCLRSNKMACKQLVLTFATIETSLCLVIVLLQLQSVLLFQVFNQHRQRQSLLRALITEKNIALRRQRYLRLRAVRRRRNSWKKWGRTSLWWDRLLNGEMDESEWKLNLRLSKENFMELVDKLRPQLAPKPRSFRPDTNTAEKKLAMTLHYLKDQGSLRVTANAFGVSPSTLSVTIHKVCRVINNVLASELSKFPTTEEELKATATAFENKFGFPQVIGCIDGTHVPIKQPLENPHDYFCYKMKYSLNVQAICNERGLFTDVDVSWPGSVHDARVFANSNINKKFQEKRLPSLYRELVPRNIPVPPVLLGDPAYPLLPNLMKEYSHCSRNEEVMFNQMLRAARNQIECAFGRLKARWRILNRPLDVSIEHAPDLIYACFVLHNYCESKNLNVSDDDVRNQINFDHSTKPVNIIHTRIACIAITVQGEAG